MRPIRISDDTFRTAVQKLWAPGAGTEVVAPLLASMVELCRPARVLEVGMGYTTPFLAAALDEIEDRIRVESQGLARKTQPYLADGIELDETWLKTQPELVNPSFYLEPYRPIFVAVDNLSIAESSAARVREVLRELGLEHRVTIVNADLRECIDLLPEELMPIDFAWVDAWECLYFFDHFWELINPDGGIVVMHYLMTYPEGEAILKYLAKFQQAHPGELEIMNLLESHKLMQNSITMLRRTSGVVNRRYATTGGQVRYDGQLRADAVAHATLMAGQTADAIPNAVAGEAKNPTANR